jgi:hypothetical protein
MKEKSFITLTPRVKVKNFLFFVDDEALSARVFLSGKPYPPNLVFASKVRLCPSGVPLRHSL